MLNWDVFVSISQIYKSLIEYEKWSMGGRGEGEERSMIWISVCRVSLQPVYVYACLHVCVGVAAALLDIWMSNDVVPDWAITTSAHLLKRGSWDGGRRMVVLVPKKWQKDQMQEILQLIEYFIYNQAVSTPRNCCCWATVVVFFLKELKRCGWYLCCCRCSYRSSIMSLDHLSLLANCQCLVLNIYD